MASRSLGVLTLDLVAKIGGFVTGMNQAERVANRKLSDIEKRALAFGKVLGAGIASGAAVATTAFIALTKQAIDVADRTDELSARLGISTEQLSAWGYAAKLSGTDLEAVASAIPKLSKNLAAALDSGDKFADIFKALGVEVKDANGNLRSVDDVLPDIADAFKGLDNETLKAALALELFGKSGAELLEFLSRGSDGLEELEEKARSLGIVIGGDTASAAAAFKDKLDDLKAVVLGVGFQLAEKLLPELNKLVSELQKVATEGGEAKQFVSDLATVIKGFSGVVAFAVRQVAVMVNQLAALRNVAEGVIGLDWNRLEKDFGGSLLRVVTEGVRGIDFGKIQDGIKKGLSGQQRSGDNLASLLIGDVSGVGESIANQIEASMRPLEERFTKKGREAAAAREEALRKLFSGGDDDPKKAKKTGKSDEEKLADQLKASYDRMNESLSEQIDLFGKDGEAARVRYELEKGSLKALTDDLAKKLGIDKESLIVNAENLDRMREELALQKELDEEHDKRQSQAQEVLDSIRQERETLGMSSDQWELYNNIKRAGINASQENIAAITEETKALQAEAKALEPQIALMDSFREGLEDSVVGVISGATSIKDAFKNLFDDLASQITRWIARRLIEQAFGGMGTTGQGSAGGFFGNFLGAFFGGGTGGGRAAGGVVSVGGMYRVNENWNRGPEILSFGNRDYLMMGSQGGRVSPTGSAGGATFGPTNIYVQGSATRETARQIDRANGRRSTRELVRTGR